MPNRILKESIRRSDTIDQLTAAEEVFFYRLLTACDDFGRFDGRAAILRAELFPLRVDSVTTATVQGWLETLVRVGLVMLYENNGKQYLQIVTWREHQQVRADKSKYPDPDAGESTILQASDSDGYQPQSSDIRFPRTRTRNRNRYTNTEQNEDVAPDGAYESVPAEEETTKRDETYPADFEQFWQEYPRKRDKGKALRAWKARVRDKANPAEMITASSNYAAECAVKGTEERYIKHAATFIGPDKPYLEYVKGIPPPETIPKPRAPVRQEPPSPFGEEYERLKAAGLLGNGNIGDGPTVPPGIRGMRDRECPN
jgi:hypothetical protein